ncbi:MAG: SRPBCC domain-containing protein [Opitutaceae bacterium]
MSLKTESAADTADREIVIARVFDAPRELVWQAWTDPSHVVRWWGPRGFTTTIESMDVRPGGVWKHTMHGPDGANYPNESIFSEVVKPERIVYSHGGRREGGPGAGFTSTWTFEALAPDKTWLTIRMVFPTAAERDQVVRDFGAIEGGKQTLDRLAEYLPNIGAARDEFVISRVFAAPRELVWNVWTQAEHLQRWFGPKGCTISKCSMDLRPEGIFHYGMRTPDGQLMWGKWIFQQVVAPEKLVFVVTFSNADRGVTRHPMNPNWPLETLSTVTFDEREDKTLLTIRWTAPDATEAERQIFDSSHESMRMGWTGTLDQLAEHLAKVGEAEAVVDGPSEREIVITRLFDASREVVFRVWTDAKHLRSWWGPNGFTNRICEVDLRPGGAWRIVMRGPNGVEYPAQGVYREVMQPERLVFTNDALDAGGSPVLKGLTTVTFEADGAKTKLTVRTRAVAVVPYARAYLNGMEAGWTQSIDRLAVEVSRVRP